MTGRVVTYRTTYKGSFPDSRPSTVPPPRRAFAANTNRPPAYSPPKPLKGSARATYGGTAYGPSAIATASGAIAAHTLVNALSGQIMDYWANVYRARPLSEVVLTEAAGVTSMQPAIQVAGNIGATPGSVVTNINYNNAQPVIANPNPGKEYAYYYPPPTTLIGSFQKQWVKKFAIPYGNPDPNKYTIPFLQPFPIVRPIAPPLELPYNRPREEALPVRDPKPGFSDLTVGTDYTPGLDPVPQTNPRKRPPPGTVEYKFSGRGVQILSFVAQAMGEGMEWLEVLTDGFGFQNERHKFFTDPIYADLATGNKQQTAWARRLAFLQSGHGQFSFDRFFRSLYKKFLEDKIAGSVFQRAVAGADALGISTRYSLTGAVA